MPAPTPVLSPSLPPVDILDADALDRVEEGVEMRVAISADMVFGVFQASQWMSMGV
jgi:hypothetical protein